jgi:hypothetical protein
LNTHLGRRCDGTIVVTLAAEPDLLTHAEAVVDAARPAGCAYVLRLRSRSTGAAAHTEVDGLWRA